MAVKLTVCLKPEIEEDLSTEIEVLTDKGICKLPVQVLSKKAVLSVSTAVLELGCIPCGQCSTQQISIANAGALQVCQCCITIVVCSYLCMA
ncbi:MAG: hypothetical protein HC767_02175 [Akkermansiaceae bacterium]|nr:hypothetical protein [Akkermansiaceae bacterium]